MTKAMTKCDLCSKEILDTDDLVNARLGVLGDEVQGPVTRYRPVKFIASRNGKPVYLDVIVGVENPQVGAICIDCLIDQVIIPAAIERGYKPKKRGSKK